MAFLELVGNQTWRQDMLSFIKEATGITFKPSDIHPSAGDRIIYNLDDDVAAHIRLKLHNNTYLTGAGAPIKCDTAETGTPGHLRYFQP